MKKAVLAYSGGLDTTFCIPYLREQGYEVIAATVDTGGLAENEDTLRDRARALGAETFELRDRKQTFYEKFVRYVITGNLLRGDVYPLCAGPERYLIAEELVKLAHEYEASTIVHGSTGAGNDQVRFDVTIQHLDPGLEIKAPVREEEFQREEEVAYLREEGVAIPGESEGAYSINRGMLGTTIGGKETTSSWKTLPEEIWRDVRSPGEAPENGRVVTLEFREGLPQSLDGELMEGPELLSELDRIGAKHGFGRGIHIGDTILGLKGRIAFEAPGVLSVIRAHRELEKISLTNKQLRAKKEFCETYGDHLHEGHYFDPVMRNIESFIDQTQKSVNGAVRLKFHRGTAEVQGVDSPDSLMDPDVAVYGEENHLWDGRDAEGFCSIYGVPEIIAGRRNHD